MTINSMAKICLAATMMLAVPGYAQASDYAQGEISWQYIDLRYLQPSNSDTRGFSGEVSGHISEKWILQGRANRLQREDKDLDLEMSQMRYDLVVGRTFAFTDRVGMLISAGYTHLDYSTEIGTIQEDERSDAGNLQAVLRARFAGSFELEGGLGMLFDDEDTSDVLWNVAFRWWASDAVSLVVGANGTDEFDGDDILYEIGFRFDLR